MPLTINVGLSRKASKDYQSSGVSINVTAELDQSLLARPRELQAEVDRLYDQAEQGLIRQANRAGSDDANGRSGNGHTPRTQNGGEMTASQRRAIWAIARRLGLDPTEEIHHQFGLRLDGLTVREASRAIDHLKSLDQPVSRNGGSQ